MRKQQFRGHDKRGWHYGDLQHRKTGMLHRVGITTQTGGKQVFYDCNPESIGEWTGVLDIYAKKACDTCNEIFEGDIVLMPDREFFHAEIIGLVVYHHGSFVVASEPDNIEWCCKWNLYNAVYAEKAYVIGNVTENPELLRGYKNTTKQNGI